MVFRASLLLHKFDPFLRSRHDPFELRVYFEVRPLLDHIRQFEQCSTIYFLGLTWDYSNMSQLFVRVLGMVVNLSFSVDALFKLDLAP